LLSGKRLRRCEARFWPHAAEAEHTGGRRPSDHSGDRADYRDECFEAGDSLRAVVASIDAVRDTTNTVADHLI